MVVGSRTSFLQVKSVPSCGWTRYASPSLSWTRGLSLPFACAWCCREYSCTSFCLNASCHFFGTFPKSGLGGSRGCYMSLYGGTASPFSTAAAPLCLPGGHPLGPILVNEGPRGTCSGDRGRSALAHCMEDLARPLLLPWTRSVPGQAPASGAVTRALKGLGEEGCRGGRREGPSEG